MSDAPTRRPERGILLPQDMTLHTKAVRLGPRARSLLMRWVADGGRPVYHDELELIVCDLVNPRLLGRLLDLGCAVRMRPDAGYLWRWYLTDQGAALGQALLRHARHYGEVQP